MPKGAATATRTKVTDEELQAFVQTQVDGGESRPQSILNALRETGRAASLDRVKKCLTLPDET